MNFSEESAWIKDGEEEGGQTAIPGKGNRKKSSSTSGPATKRGGGL